MLHENLFLWQAKDSFIADSVSFSKINTLERGQEILFSLREIKNDSVYYSNLSTSHSPS